MSTDGMVTLTIDGKQVTVPKNTTLYDAAAKLNIKVPVLCHREHMNPVAVCRVCVVDVKGQWRLAPACQRTCEDKMEVGTAATSDRVRNSVKLLTELLLADHKTPREKHKDYGENELETLAGNFGVHGSRFPAAERDRGHDETSVVIAVDHNACILCDRCVRACNDIRNNQVIGRAGKGYKAKIAFDLDDPMGTSSCVACGECMVSCPTGALTNRSFVGVHPWTKTKPAPEKVTADDLFRHPLFDGVAKPFLKWNEGAVVRRHFKKGDVICKEGDFGSTAFIIEKGRVEIHLQAPMKHAQSRQKGKGGKGGGLFGFGRRTSLASRNEEAASEPESTQAFIHIDAPVSLRFDKPVAELGPEDVIFGEMTCMNNYPRSATVTAKSDVTVLEVLRNVLYILQRNKKSKALLDNVYRNRTIDSHLRSVPIFGSLQAEPHLFDKFVEIFKKRVELVRLNPGEVVFRQGDPADAFYLVRVGFIKVSQNRLGGEYVVTYLGPGKYFGEIGLMTHVPEVHALTAPGIRTATCTALDHVDVVKMKAADFREVIDKFPTVRRHLVKMAVEHLNANEEARKRVETVSLSDYLSQGLQEAQSLLVLDLEKCTRCDECTKACADAHDGVTRLIREGLRFNNWLVASSCRSCLDPYCMVGCPVGSIRRRNSREIIIEDWCIGCGKCSENCPYGNINMHGFATGEKMTDPDTGKKVAVVQQKATMCDLCSDLDGKPSCVYACPHDAAHRMRGKDLLKLVEGRVTV